MLTQSKEWVIYGFLYMVRSTCLVISELELRLERRKMYLGKDKQLFTRRLRSYGGLPKALKGFPDVSELHESD